MSALTIVDTDILIDAALQISTAVNCLDDLKSPRLEEKVNKPEIPATDSIEELARFWDTHDLTDFEDQLEPVTEPIFERKTTISHPAAAHPPPPPESHPPLPPTLPDHHKPSAEPPQHRPPDDDWLLEPFTG